jgi:hypothetical protein
LQEQRCVLWRNEEQGAERVSRRIIYRIFDNGANRFSESEWGEIERLQHWYNSEFSWSTGRLAIKRYVLFPNAEDFQNLDTPIWEVIGRRHAALRTQGLSEPAIISQMEKDRLLTAKWGGYYDNCLASGFTRVADNEWNAYLVCDFLLKGSTLIPNATINIEDEGKFVKSGKVDIRNGVAEIKEGASPGIDVKELRATGKVFSLVDPAKYNRHPGFRNMIPEFNKLKASEQKKVVRNWNWLGYEGNFDANGDDFEGFDLNTKIRNIIVSK